MKFSFLVFTYLLLSHLETECAPFMFKEVSAEYEESEPALLYRRYDRVGDDLPSRPVNVVHTHLEFEDSLYKPRYILANNEIGGVGQCERHPFNHILKIMDQ